jgi:hypothetical protein
MLMFCGGAEGDEMLESMGVKRGRTPLHLAVVRGEAQMVRLLLARGADVNAADVVGRTPLMVAVERESEPMLRELLAAGADPNATDANKETPLKLAAGNDAIVRLLKEAGAAAPPPRRKRPAKAKRTPKRAARRQPAPPLPEPDFSAAARSPEYARAVEEMEQRCGSKTQPIKGVEGAYRYHVHSSKRIDLRALHEEMLARGFYAFSTGATEDDELALAPTADKYEVIAAVGTNGANYDLGPPEVVQWLRDLEREVPFILTGIGFDFLKGHFTGPRAGPEDLARRMYEFCPDIVDQGCGTVEKLADSLAESDGLFFWWD